MDFQFDVSAFAIVVLTVVIFLQQWVISRMSKGLETSFPASISAFIPTVIQVARDQAEKTPSSLDDKAVDLLEAVTPFVSKGVPPAEKAG